MAKPTVPENEFIELFTKHGGEETARILGIDRRRVYERRARLERKNKVTITNVNGKRALKGRGEYEPEHIEGRHHEEVKNGVVLIGSDAHYWPGIISTAHRAFVHFCGMLKPKIVVMNGDVFDGASISRFPTASWSEWEGRPSVAQEIEACQDRLEEIEKAAKGAKFIWPLGNHDARLEMRIANNAPELAKMRGVHLRDHFPRWKPCWSVWINNDIAIKHRYKGGDHAAHNNTIRAGMSMVTGHLHSLKVTPWTDYNGTRYGVDTGTLAEPNGRQFQHYLEDNPVNWRSGFVVLTFRDGRLMWPELVSVMGEGEVCFRGEIIKV